MRFAPNTLNVFPDCSSDVEQPDAPQVDSSLIEDISDENMTIPRKLDESDIAE